MPHLGIDIRVLARAPHHGLGVWRYVCRILERLPDDPTWTIELFGDRPADALGDGAPIGRFPYHHVPQVPRLASEAVWEQFALPRSGAFRRLDCFWSPNYSTPLAARVRRVVTIHDISFDRPGMPRGPWRMRAISHRSAHAAAVVLTDSQFSAEDLHNLWGVPRERIAVVPLAADPPDSTWPARASSTLARLGITRPFVLHVGTMYSRRHVPVLIDAYRRVVHAGAGVDLVVVGRNRTDPYVAIEGDLAAINDRAGRVIAHHLPFVSDADLAVLMGSARAFAYLSSLEGFGLPPLEAMAYGTPVIATDGGSMREFTVGSAWLVDPTSADQVAEALNAILSRPEEADRLRRQGLAKAATYSWERCASETWAVLTGEPRRA
jgi:glycosyltransferase involved in cell wall biosynthesis